MHITGAFCARYICLGGAALRRHYNWKIIIIISKKNPCSLGVFEFGLKFSESRKFAKILILVHFLKSAGCYHLVCLCMNECICIIFSEKLVLKLILLFLFSILNFKELQFFLKPFISLCFLIWNSFQTVYRLQPKIFLAPKARIPS